MLVPPTELRSQDLYHCGGKIDALTTPLLLIAWENVFSLSQVRLVSPPALAP
jgi:hypothetical protein